MVRTDGHRPRASCDCARSERGSACSGPQGHPSKDDPALYEDGRGGNRGVEARIEHLFAASHLGKVACGADCSYCCYVPRVLVTLPELARIVERLRSWPADQIETLKARLEAHVLAQSTDATSPAARPPCALLVDGSPYFRYMTFGRSCAAVSIPTMCRIARYTAKPAPVRRRS